MDAVQHSEEKDEAIEVKSVAISEVQSPPQPYQDSTETNDVVQSPERIAKNVIGDDRSLLSLLGRAPKVREKILLLQKDNPDLLNTDESFFKQNHRDVITLVTQRIRVSLWQEYEAAIQNNRLMKISQIYAGTCSESAFYALVDNPNRLAYILCPPADYIVMLKEAHGAGLEKLREVFSARILDEEGYLNPKAADIVIKAFALLDARLKGAVVQRVDQRVLTANVSPASQNGQTGMPPNMEALEIELAKTREQLAKMVGVPRHPTVIELNEEMKDIEIQKIDMNQNPSIGGSAKVLK